MQLYEKYRPKTLDDFIGQDRIKKQLSRIMARPDFDRDALFLAGPSGCGKTSLGLILANMLVETDQAITEIDGDMLNIGMLNQIRESIWLCPGKGKWKVFVINEAHAMSRQAVQGFLTLLENLPSYRLFIFTTTENLDTDLFGNFTSPFARRCKCFSFSNQGLAQLFATRAREIAQIEGLDGKPNQAYMRLVQACKNNFGMVLQKIDQGEMLL